MPTLFAKRVNALVLNVRTQDFDREQQTQCIDQDMTLAPVDFLAGVIAFFAALLGRLHGLAVDDARTRLRVAADGGIRK